MKLDFASHHPISLCRSIEHSCTVLTRMIDRKTALAMKPWMPTLMPMIRAEKMLLPGSRMDLYLPLEKADSRENMKLTA